MTLVQKVNDMTHQHPVETTVQASDSYHGMNILLVVTPGPAALQYVSSLLSNSCLNNYSQWQSAWKPLLPTLSSSHHFMPVHPAPVFWPSRQSRDNAPQLFACSDLRLPSIVLVSPLPICVAFVCGRPSSQTVSAQRHLAALEVPAGTHTPVFGRVSCAAEEEGFPLEAALAPHHREGRKDVVDLWVRHLTLHLQPDRGIRAVENKYRRAVTNKENSN